MTILGKEVNSSIKEGQDIKKQEGPKNETPSQMINHVEKIFNTLWFKRILKDKNISITEWVELVAKIEHLSPLDKAYLGNTLAYLKISNPKQLNVLAQKFWYETADDFMNKTSVEIIGWKTETLSSFVVAFVREYSTNIMIGGELIKVTPREEAAIKLRELQNNVDSTNNWRDIKISSFDNENMRLAEKKWVSLWEKSKNIHGDKPQSKDWWREYSSLAKEFETAVLKQIKLDLKNGQNKAEDIIKTVGIELSKLSTTEKLMVVSLLPWSAVAVILKKEYEKLDNNAKEILKDTATNTLLTAFPWWFLLKQELVLLKRQINTMFS